MKELLQKVEKLRNRLSVELS